MSHSRFVRTVAIDVTGAILVAFALVGVSLIAPGWVVGVLLLGLVPALVVAIILDACLRRPLTETDRYCSGVDVEVDQQSRRRDTATSPRAIHAHRAPQNLPAAAPTNKGQARPDSPSGRAARPDVVTAYVDLAWLTHDACMHTYQATRPGR